MRPHVQHTGYMGLDVQLASSEQTTSNYVLVYTVICVHTLQQIVSVYLKEVEILQVHQYISYVRTISSTHIYPY